MIDISNFPVMDKKCGSCPFRIDSRGLYFDCKLVDRIKIDILSNSSQICHHPRLIGKEETHLCRGARDYQLKMFYRLVFLDSSTDKAWNEKNKALKKKYINTPK